MFWFAAAFRYYNMTVVPSRRTDVVWERRSCAIMPHACCRDFQCHVQQKQALYIETGSCVTIIVLCCPQSKSCCASSLFAYNDGVSYKYNSSLSSETRERLGLR
jgi:hypothetical protein